MGYLRLAFHLAEPQQCCRPVTKLIFWYPFTRFARQDALSRYAVTNRDSVLWWTMRSPTGGRFLPPAWLHSHRARFAGMLLVNGRHSPLSLAGDACLAGVDMRCGSLTGLRSLLIEL